MSRLKMLKRLALGTTIAATAGYVAGLLTAPKSGRETREDLRDTVDSSRTKVEKQLKDLHTELGSLIDKASSEGEALGWRARRELRDLTDQASDTKQKLREVLSAIHDGDADDKDLGKALKEAHKAVDHLKKFFKS
jgi:gas vesicle protein